MTISSRQLNRNLWGALDDIAHDTAEIADPDEREEATAELQQLRQRLANVTASLDEEEKGRRS